MRTDAILPAAGRISGDFAAETGVEVKALITLGGQTLLERTITALRSSGLVERIVIIGPEEVTEHPVAQEADAALPEGGPTSPANIFRGLEWLHQRDGRYPERLLVLTTDLPFLTPEGIAGFLEACPDDTDLCVPLFTREEMEARFPGLKTQYVRLRDGEWTMGCAFLINPAVIIKNLPLIESAFLARKSQIRMARLLGPSFIARFLMRRLSVTHIIERCSQILGCSGTAVLGCAPELALDIDRVEEYRYATQHCAAL